MTEVVKGLSIEELNKIFESEKENSAEKCIEESVVAESDPRNLEEGKGCVWAIREEDGAMIYSGDISKLLDVNNREYTIEKNKKYLCPVCGCKTEHVEYGANGCFKHSRHGDKEIKGKCRLYTKSLIYRGYNPERMKLLTYRKNEVEFVLKENNIGVYKPIIYFNYDGMLEYISENPNDNFIVIGHPSMSEEKLYELADSTKSGIFYKKATWKYVKSLQKPLIVTYAGYENIYFFDVVDENSQCDIHEWYDEYGEHCIKEDDRSVWFGIVPYVMDISLLKGNLGLNELRFYFKNERIRKENEIKEMILREAERIKQERRRTEEAKKEKERIEMTLELKEFMSILEKESECSLEKLREPRTYGNENFLLNGISEDGSKNGYYVVFIDMLSENVNQRVKLFEHKLQNQFLSRQAKNKEDALNKELLMKYGMNDEEIIKENVITNVRGHSNLYWGKYCMLKVFNVSSVQRKVVLIYKSNK